MSPEYIKEVLQKIRTEYNIDDLANYRAFFKKHVPFFMRSWFAAALMLELDGAPASRRSANGNRASRSASRSSRGAAGDTASSTRKARNAAPSSTTPSSTTPSSTTPSREASAVRERPQTEPTPRVVIPEDEASTLFFSAGRKRRVYPRDIVGFVLKESSIGRDDIGDIRILDNFSFVQVRKTVADSLISELNEKPFRGRSLTVSYAKPRPDPSDADYVSADDDSDSEADDTSLNTVSYEDADSNAALE